MVSENAAPEDILQAANTTHTAIRTLLESVETQTDGLPMRELEDFDNGVQRLRGALADVTAKLVEVDANIARNEQKLRELGKIPNPNRAIRETIETMLQQFIGERAGHLEVIDALRGRLRNQITSIRETIDDVLNSDTTLAERIKTVSRTGCHDFAIVTPCSRNIYLKHISQKTIS